VEEKSTQLNGIPSTAYLRFDRKEVGNRSLRELLVSTSISRIINAINQLLLKKIKHSTQKRKRKSVSRKAQLKV